LEKLYFSYARGTIMSEEVKELSTVRIESLIFNIRGRRVIVASDLALIYGVSTKRLNEQVKRNRERFPEDFMFQLKKEEAQNWQRLRSQFATLKRGQHIKYLPYAFTEYGAIMAANMLNSPKAIEMSVFVVRAFVRMREEISAHRALEKRLAEIENNLLTHDAALRDLYQKIRPLLLPAPRQPRKKIGFDLKEKQAKYKGRKRGY